MKKIYNMLETKHKDIDQLISELEKLEIFGENPTIHWDRDKTECKLVILNPNLKISTAKIEASNDDIKEFEMHIGDLNKLKIIRRSESPHRSATFIVKKHSEIVRGKSRMIINYKILNDNTKEESYDIPDKNQLINRIQYRYIFSKFDCKSGFWQVRMHLDSIEWIALTCPLGHFEWLVMPFGLKKCPSNLSKKNG